MRPLSRRQFLPSRRAQRSWLLCQRSKEFFKTRIRKAKSQVSSASCSHHFAMMTCADTPPSSSLVSACLMFHARLPPMTSGSPTVEVGLEGQRYVSGGMPMARLASQPACKLAHAAAAMASAKGWIIMFSHRYAAQRAQPPRFRRRRSAATITLPARRRSVPRRAVQRAHEHHRLYVAHARRRNTKRSRHEHKNAEYVGGTRTSHVRIRHAPYSHTAEAEGRRR